MASTVVVHSPSVQDLQHELSSIGLTELPAGVLVYSIDGPFFFGAVETFERALSQTHTDPRVVILRMDDVPFMDITGLQALEEAIQQLRKRGVRVILCGALDSVKTKLRKAGILAVLGKENVHEQFVDALRAGATNL